METWLKAKADQLAQAAQQQVSAVQESATKLAGDVLEHVRGPEDDCRKDLEFVEEVLGFTLEGRLVVDVQANTQADRLGLAIGDRLLRVDGYEVPECESGGFEEQRNRALIAKWLKDMPRPGILTFEMPYDDEASPVSEAGPEVSEGQKSSAVQTLQAELGRVQEERKKLRLQLQEAQEQAAAVTKELEALRREQELQSSAAAEVRGEREARQALAERLEAAESDLAASQQALEPLRQELQGFRAAHEAEMELLREEHERRLKSHELELQDFEQRLEEQRCQAKAELEGLQETLERCRESLQEAQVNAEASAVEAHSLRMEMAQRGAAGEAPEEVARLQRRVELLESRAVRRVEPQERQRPPWEQWLAATAGPHATALVVAGHQLLLTALRAFLERLLRSEAWLWVFYAHLLVLYALAAWSSVATSADAGHNAVESLNAQLAAAKGHN